MLVFVMADMKIFQIQLNCAKEDKVTDEIIKNAFIKANLRISLDSAVTKTFDNNEFLNIFNNFNITATELDIIEFVAIHDESSNFFQDAILEKAKPLFEEHQAVNQDDTIPSDEVELKDVNTTGPRLQLYNINKLVIFLIMFKQSVYHYGRKVVFN